MAIKSMTPLLEGLGLGRGGEYKAAKATKGGRVTRPRNRRVPVSSRTGSDSGRPNPAGFGDYPKPAGIRDFLTCRETPRKSGLELGRIRKKRRCPKSDGFWIFLAHRCTGSEPTSPVTVTTPTNRTPAPAPAPAPAATAVASPAARGPVAWVLPASTGAPASGFTSGFSSDLVLCLTLLPRLLVFGFCFYYLVY